MKLKMIVAATVAGMMVVMAPPAFSSGAPASVDGVWKYVQGKVEQSKKPVQPSSESLKKETPKPEPASQPKPIGKSDKLQPQPQNLEPEAQQKADAETQFEREIIRLTNVERSQKGLAPLKTHAELSKVARLKSEDLRDKNYFSHDSPTYGSPFDMIKKFGIKYLSVGENIAAGYSTPEQVVQGWMDSEGHRANILDKNYTHIGVGYAKGGSYGHYETQLFIKTTDDSSSPESQPKPEPRPEPAPSPKPVPQSQSAPQAQPPKEEPESQKPDWEQKADAIIAQGKKFLGTEYQYGAKNYDLSGKFDCSSFTQYVYGKQGIQLQRTAASQAERDGIQIKDKSQLRKGDLLFFDASPTAKGRYMNIDHVGIYLGDNKILHTYKKGVGVTITDFEGTFWGRQFIIGARVIGND